MEAEEIERMGHGDRRSVVEASTISPTIGDTMVPGTAEKEPPKKYMKKEKKRRTRDHENFSRNR